MSLSLLADRTVHAQLSSGAKDLKPDLSHHLSPYVLRASNEGSGKTVRMTQVHLSPCY